jgi:hypothetical protein
MVNNSTTLKLYYIFVPVLMPGPGFTSSNVVVFFVLFNCLRWEMVDVGGLA